MYDVSETIRVHSRIVIWSIKKPTEQIQAWLQMV